MFKQDHECSGGPGIGVTHSLVSPVPQRGECWNQGLQRGQAAAALWVWLDTWPSTLSPHLFSKTDSTNQAGSVRNSISIQFFHHLFSDVFTVYNMCFCEHVHTHTTHTRLVSPPTGIFAARAILCVAFSHCKHSAIIFIPFRTKREKKIWPWHPRNVLPLFCFHCFILICCFLDSLCLLTTALTAQPEPTVSTPILLVPDPLILCVL